MCNFATLIGAWLQSGFCLLISCVLSFNEFSVNKADAFIVITNRSEIDLK